MYFWHLLSQALSQRDLYCFPLRCRKRWQKAPAAPASCLLRMVTAGLTQLLACCAPGLTCQDMRAHHHSCPLPEQRHPLSGQGSPTLHTPAEATQGCEASALTMRLSLLPYLCQERSVSAPRSLGTGGTLLFALSPQVMLRKSVVSTDGI